MHGLAEDRIRKNRAALLLQRMIRMIKAKRVARRRRLELQLIEEHQRAEEHRERVAMFAEERLSRAMAQARTARAAIFIQRRFRTNKARRLLKELVAQRDEQLWLKAWLAGRATSDPRSYQDVISRTRAERASLRQIFTTSVYKVIIILSEINCCGLGRLN